MNALFIAHDIRPEQSGGNTGEVSMWIPSTFDKRRAQLALHHISSWGEMPGVADVQLLRKIVPGKRAAGTKAEFVAAIRRIYIAAADFGEQPVLTTAQQGE